MSLVTEIHSLSRVHWRAFIARVRHMLKNSRLLCGTIAFFLLGYLVSGYFMLERGLDFMASLPGIGLLLAGRMLYMTFFFFFLMLVFSNSVLLYSALFRGKETAWLLTTPVSPRAVFCWKVIESFIASSWGLAVLSAPLLAAVGKVYGAPPAFYFKCLLVYIPFLVMPAMVGGMLTVLLVKYWGRTLKWIGIVTAGAIAWKLAAAWHSGGAQAANAATMADLQSGLNQLLGHAELATSPFLPSAWMTEMILHWSRGFESRGIFFGLLLTSWSLLLGWVCVVLVSRLTYPAWNLSQQRKASHTRKAGTGATDIAAAFTGGWTRFLPFLRHDTRAMIRKDLKEFGRDTAQWVPCLVVFVLLLVYSANLNRSQAAGDDPTFRFILRALCFGVSILTLSTLTTRFIFPVFSIEGRRLWVLGLSPVGMERVFLIKLALFGGIAGSATAVLMFVSGRNLHMSPLEQLYFCSSVMLMSGGLTGLALGLGVLFPNFYDASPAKIVSGFGGTLCLIINFVYILCALGVFLWPVYKIHLSANNHAHELFMVPGFLCVLAITLLAGGIPSILAIRKLRSKAFMGRL